MLSKTILQMLHRCCFLEVEGAGADADIRSIQSIYRKTL